VEEKNDINKSKDTNKANILKQIITGRIFVSTRIQKHSGYIVFLFLLAILYIGYRYKVDSTALASKELDKQIQWLRTDYIRKLTTLMQKGTKLETLKQIREKSLTLKEPQNPFIQIKID
jgi:hypothetical protein